MPLESYTDHPQIICVIISKGRRKLNPKFPFLLNSLSQQKIKKMSSAETELLTIGPLELKFAFELKKQISCSLQLSNKTENHVAFKVKTTNPKKYCVRPNTGIVLPRSTCDVIGIHIFFLSI